MPDGEAPQEQQAAQEPKQGAGKFVPKEALDAQKAENRELLATLKRQEEAQAATMKRIEAMEQTEAKRNALAKARKAIGDKYTIEGREDAIEAHVNDLPFDPATIEAKIVSFIDLVKIPRVAPSPAMNGTPANDPTGGGPRKQAKDYTPAELKKLETEDPDGFKRVCAERLEATIWGKKGTE